MAQLFYLDTDESGFPKEYFSTSAIVSIEHFEDDHSNVFSIIKLSNDRNLIVKNGAEETAKIITSPELIVRFETGNPKFNDDPLEFVFI